MSPAFMLVQSPRERVRPAAGVAPGPTLEPRDARLRLILVADVCLYREGLAHSLALRADAHVLGTAADGPAALELVRRHGGALVLLDMVTPGAPGIARDVRDADSLARVVALAVDECHDQVLACAEAGLAGYVPRTATMEELIETLQRVARGELVCPPSITGSLFRRVGALAGRPEPPASAPAPPPHLTPRECEIVALIDQGLSNKEISRRLRIGPSTVKNHIHNLLEKLHVSRRGAAAARMRLAGAERAAL